jgi:hypothetical protein
MRAGYNPPDEISASPLTRNEPWIGSVKRLLPLAGVHSLGKMSMKGKEPDDKNRRAEIGQCAGDAAQRGHDRKRTPWMFEALILARGMGSGNEQSNFWPWRLGRLGRGPGLFDTPWSAYGLLGGIGRIEGKGSYSWWLISLMTPAASAWSTEAVGAPAFSGAPFSSNVKPGDIELGEGLPLRTNSARRCR